MAPLLRLAQLVDEFAYAIDVDVLSSHQGFPHEAGEDLEELAQLVLRVHGFFRQLAYQICVLHDYAFA